jgi:hypothetical protein
MSDYSGGNESRYLHYPPPQIHPSKTAAPSAVFIFLGAVRCRRWSR